MPYERVGRQSGRVLRDAATGRLLLGCCCGEPGVSVLCCAGTPIPRTLCVTLGDPGGPFDGISFPIYYAGDLGCGEVWYAYGTPPELAGFVEWYHDRDPLGVGSCVGFFRFLCTNVFGPHQFVIESSSTGDYDLGSAVADTEQCDPFLYVYTLTVTSATGTSSRTITATVTPCDGDGTAYIRVCPTGIPSVLEAVFTLTAGSDAGCGLDGLAFGVRFHPCSTAPLGFCTLYQSTTQITIIVAGNPQVVDLNLSVIVNVTTGQLRLVAVMATSGGSVICQTSLTGAALTVVGCAQFEATGFQFGGALCPCNSSAATYDVVVLG